MESAIRQVAAAIVAAAVAAVATPREARPSAERPPSATAADAPSFGLCDGRMDAPSRWKLPPRWGQVEFARREPFASACGHDGTSRRLVARQVADDGVRRVFVAMVEEQERRRGTERHVEVSFLVPAAQAGWNHVAAFPAFGPARPEYRRAGAAAFAHALMVEIVDRRCAPEGNLHAAVPILDRVRPGRWYRLYADVDLRDGGRSLRVSASLADLERFEMVAETAIELPCRASWVRDARTSAGFAATSPPGDPEDEPAVLVDDFAASVSEPPPDRGAATRAQRSR